MQNFRVTVNGKVFEVTVEDMGAEAPARTKEQMAAVTEESIPAPAPMEASPAKTPAALSEGDKPVNAPLSGTIMAIKVKPGDQVKYGQVLLTLEALKMENEIVAPEAGVVKEIYVQAGSAVKVGDLLATLQ
jgi:biotin carboxyl carrier protein